MTGAVDPPYSKPNRYMANVAAVVAATPQYPGELVVVLDTFDSYQASDSTVGHWQKQAVRQ
jgi:hypothetical protein